MDLIKDFNPVSKPARVSAGLPFTAFADTGNIASQAIRRVLSPHRRIVSEPDAADEYAQRLRNKGYRVSITPRKVSEDLLLHRVEIDGLKNLEEANHIWLTGLSNEWLGFRLTIRSGTRSAGSAS